MPSTTSSVPANNPPGAANGGLLDLDDLMMGTSASAPVAAVSTITPSDEPIDFFSDLLGGSSSPSPSPEAQSQPTQPQSQSQQHPRGMAAMSQAVNSRVANFPRATGEVVMASDATLQASCQILWHPQVSMALVCVSNLTPTPLSKLSLKLLPPPHVSAAWDAQGEPTAQVLGGVATVPTLAAFATTTQLVQFHPTSVQGSSAPTRLGLQLTYLRGTSPGSLTSAIPVQPADILRPMPSVSTQVFGQQWTTLPQQIAASIPNSSCTSAAEVASRAKACNLHLVQSINQEHILSAQLCAPGAPVTCLFHVRLGEPVQVIVKSSSAQMCQTGSMLLQDKLR